MKIQGKNASEDPGLGPCRGVRFYRLLAENVISRTNALYCDMTPMDIFFLAQTNCFIIRLELLTDMTMGVPGQAYSSRGKISS